MTNFDDHNAAGTFPEQVLPLLTDLIMVLADNRPHGEYVAAMNAINQLAANVFEVYLAASGMVAYGSSLADQAHQATCNCGKPLKVELGENFDIDSYAPYQRAVYRFVLAQWHDDEEAAEAVFCTVPTSDLPAFFTGLAVYVGRSVDRSLCLLDPERHHRGATQ